ncbi:MAG: choice-of-anchor D domain-containing protein, partial [Candidatus Acidiferrales bacterium]
MRRAARILPAAAKSGAAHLVSSVVAHLPLSFEQNRGQASAGAKYVSRGPGYSLSLTSRGAVFVHRAKVRSTGGDWLSNLASFVHSSRTVSDVVRLSWLGANPNARGELFGLQQGTSNYILGNDPRKWHTDVPRYGKVRFDELYHGIDLVYHGNRDRVEMDYVISPHADPRAIRVGIGGPSLVSIEPDGNLSISSAGDEVRLNAPVAYQQIHGQRRIVEARYVLQSSHTVGFAFGAYDPSEPLTIDPVLDYSASFGGGDDMIADVATDSQGNVYLTGTTCSNTYPVTADAEQTSFAGFSTSYACNDVIVTKLDPAASTLIYSTYIGGSNADFSVRMFVDSSGEVLLGGSTNSPDFPTTSGAYLTSLKSATCNFSPYITNQQCSDGFLLKLNSSGSSLVFSTLLGGNDRIDLIDALAVDATSGNIYVAGATNSVTFPIAQPTLAPQPAYGGDNGSCQLMGTFHVPCFDAFVAEFNSTGTSLLASTYLGGTDDDSATALAVDSNHNVYVTGTTDSTGFPVTTGAFKTTHSLPADQRDVFVTKLNSTLSALTYSTFIGGSSDDFPFMIRVDANGYAYLTGSTVSSDFPTTTGALQTAYAGPSSNDCPSTLETLDYGLLYCGDAFITKLAQDGKSLVFSTYLGTAQDDGGLNLALDSSQNVWLTGGTQSSSFPLTSDAYYNSTNFATSAFLAEIKSDGSANLFSTMIPGRFALALDVDSSDNVIVAGENPQTGVATTVIPGTYSNGQGGVFLMKFSPGTSRPSVQISPTALTFGPSGPTGLPAPLDAATPPQSITLTNSGTATLHLKILLTAGTGNPLLFSESDNCGASLAASATCTINVIYQPTTAASGSNDAATIVISDDAPGAPHTIQLTGRTGLMESASFVPATLTFNGQQPGSTSAGQISSLSTSLSAINSLAPFTTGPPVLGGANASDFRVDSSTCAVGVAYCYVTVTFSPVGNTPTTRTATVTVPTSAPQSPQVLTLTGTISTAPFLKVSGVSIPPTTVGQTLKGAFAITNVGGATLNVTGLSVTGPQASDFVVTPESCASNVPFSLAPQAVCLLNVAFAPSAHGTRNAIPTFADNENTPTTVALSGYGSDSGGPQLDLVITPNLINNQILYPDTVVGRTGIYNTALITVLNAGPTGSGANLHITSTTLTGDFTQTNTCPAPATGIGSGCTYTVLFAPTAQGLRTGVLTIVTDAPGGQTFTVNLAGTGVLIPTVSVNPTSLQFGSQVVGTASAAQSVTVSNTGNGVLNLSNLALAGPFTQTTTCGASVAPSSSCMYSIKFAPSASGPAGGTLTATTNAAGGLIGIGLNGTGATGPVPLAQPTNLTFSGTQPVGTTSASVPVTLRNVGDAAFMIAGVRASENFSETNNCPSSLAAGASCTINVSFAPTIDTYTGSNFTTTGSLFVTTGTSGSPIAVPLTGYAVASTGAATN